VFSRPRQLASESDLYAAATRILMRRAHSVYEMKQALAHRTDDDQLIATTIDRLKREGLIDDARYAKQFARQRTEVRRQGRFRIARDLRARGVPDRHIEAALEENAQEHDEVALVRQRIERKLRLSRGEITENKIASLYRSLLRAGFSADVVRRELKSLTREDLPEIDDSSEASS
jgi:regulatory protein